MMMIMIKCTSEARMTEIWTKLINNWTIIDQLMMSKIICGCGLPVEEKLACSIGSVSYDV